MNRHRVATPAMLDLQRIKERLAAGLRLDENDSAIVIELIDAIIGDRDPRNRYLQTTRGRPEKDFSKKITAVMLIASICGPDKRRPDDEILERVAAEVGLSFDVVKHAYQKYLAAPAKIKRSADKGDK